MKIYNATEKIVKRHVVDPELGHVVREERVVKASDLIKISRDGVTYERDAHGSFDVPEALGRFLISTPGWNEGENPYFEGSGADGTAEDELAALRAENEKLTKERDKAAAAAEAAGKKAAAAEGARRSPATKAN